MRPHAPEAPEDEPRPWGRFYAEDRIAPYIGPSRDAGSLTRREAGLIERVCARLADGDFDAPQPELTRRCAQERGDRVAVARTHGDLWTGNVLWAPAVRVASWAPASAGKQQAQFASFSLLFLGGRGRGGRRLFRLRLPGAVRHAFLGHL